VTKRRQNWQTARSACRNSAHCRAGFRFLRRRGGRRMPHPTPSHFIRPCAQKGQKRLVTVTSSKSPINPNRRIRASSAKSPSLTNFIAPQSTQICAGSFRQPMLPGVRQFLCEQRASGLNGILTGYSVQTARFGRSKMLSLDFVRLFAIAMSKPTKFIMPTKLGRKGWGCVVARKRND
jgi:hypothetical protein